LTNSRVNLANFIEAKDLTDLTPNTSLPTFDIKRNSNTWTIFKPLISCV